MSNEVVAINKENNLSAQNAWTKERIQLVKDVYAKGASDLELLAYIDVCRKLNVSPEARQIYLVPRWDSGLGRNVMTPQLSIDGARLVAKRSKCYGGQLGPFFTDGKFYKDERTGCMLTVWFDGWYSDKPPVAARVGVINTEFAEPVWAVANYRSYVQTNKGGNPTPLWAKMPEVMLAKCAESLALRKAFPNEIGGLYTVEEMGQANKNKEGRPVFADIKERQEQMLQAFCLLAEKQGNENTSAMRYVLEDMVGGKKIEDFDAVDIEALQKIYHKLATGKLTWENAIPTPPEQTTDKVIDVVE